MTLLEIDGLSLRTGDGRQVLSDLALSIGAGARLGLIGESGSGKSLTALASVGLLPQGFTATGSVLVHPPGRSPVQVVGGTERALNRVRGSTVALVFQEPTTALDPLMRAGRQLAEPLRRHRGLRGGALRRAVLAALDEVRIDDPDRVSRAFPHELSGGQRQRVAIAAALACEPALLVADEPTTALDVTVQADVLALLDGLVAARGMALLFISHDLTVVSRVTDDVVVLRAGSVVESGPLHQILSAPRHPYTRELLTAARAFDEALDRSPP